MKELKKVKHNTFKEYFEGYAQSGVKIMCILDDYCVRYVIFDENEGRLINRVEYRNQNKELCFRRATEALNREYGSAL